MEVKSRRQFLGKALQGIGIGLLAWVPGSFFNSGQTLAQVQKVAPKTLDLSNTATLKSVLPKTTSKNVIQVLQTTNLSAEDKLAVLAVRQLGTDQLKQQLAKVNTTTVVQGTVGTHCGEQCGDECGDDCGTHCGYYCNVQTPENSASGAFCGGNCNVKAGVMGVLDSSGQLGINFTKLNIQRFNNAISEALNLIR